MDARHLVVAEDECNTLLVYRFGEEKPVGELQCPSPLRLVVLYRTKNVSEDGRQYGQEKIQQKKLTESHPEVP